MSAKIIQGDAIESLRQLEAQSVQTCVTSPPYWGLRDYGTAQWEGGDPNCKHQGMEARTVSGGDGKQYTNAGSNRVFSGDCKCGAKRIDHQLGLEKTPEEYVAKLVEIFREVKRVLRDDGTIWVNLGDSYNGRDINRSGRNGYNDGRANRTERYSVGGVHGLKPKDLCGIPWRVAFALQADGWYLRSDIIWNKPNPMPESVTDRPTKSHEYIFMLSKKAKYYYCAEAIKEPLICAAHAPNNKKLDQSRNDHDQMDKVWGASGYRNKRSVWTVATAPYKSAHFATFPPKLIEPCILAGCPTGGTVLDPFAGSGTTGMVAEQNGRNSILIELNPKYCEMIKKRLQPYESTLFR